MDNTPIRNAHSVVALLTTGKTFEQIKHRLVVRNASIWQHYAFGAMAVTDTMKMDTVSQELECFCDHLSSLIHEESEAITKQVTA